MYYIQYVCPLLFFLHWEGEGKGRRGVLNVERDCTKELYNYAKLYHLCMVCVAV